jgi:hypothetical protein
MHTDDHVYPGNRGRIRLVTKPKFMINLRIRPFFTDGKCLADEVLL